MKICVYVSESHAKQNYKRESYNVRKNAGLQVVKDILERNGYAVDFAGSHSAQLRRCSCQHYSDCDWWPFIAERIRWRKSN